MIKSITIAYRKPELSPEEFYRYWKEQHGPLCARLMPGLRKYVQNHFISAPGYQFEGDGMVEMWYDDLDAFKKSWEFGRTPEGRELAMDGAKFSAMKPGSGLWLAEEHIIKDELNPK
jgi:uncharacterized protein (TIGR02118 family)